jgi:GNAT superfamily N-acetyltransferase
MGSAKNHARASMHDPMTATPTRGLVTYLSALDDDILRFNREAYPLRRSDWVEPRWRWMFLASAARLGVPPMVWMYKTSSGIVGHQGAIPVTLWSGQRSHQTGWFVETMVLDSHRRKGVGPMLIKKALEDLPVNISLGQTADMRALQFALGWVQVARLDEYIYVLDASTVLAGKVPALLRPFAALALAGQQRLRARRRTEARHLVVRSIPHFGAEHDRLWEGVRHRFGCAVVRDASYLNWKYVDQPGQAFARLEVRRDGQVVAVVVTTVRRGEPGYAYPRGLIIDLLTDPTDADAVHAALGAACDQLRQDGAALARFDLLNEGLAQHVQEFGFSARGAERMLLVSTGGADSATARHMTDASGWLVTAGDSDIDRPW